MRSEPSVSDRLSAGADGQKTLRAPAQIKVCSPFDPSGFLLDTHTICLLRRCEGERQSSDERGKTKRKSERLESEMCVRSAELQFAQRSMLESCL